jgi:poly-gamma-glutamate capsule biosynthesis protein CapA/YwtB (metallophosphatase superfamily)
MKLLLTGDVMLGRLVDQAIAYYGIEYPMGGISAVFKDSDYRIVNLECAITSCEQKWRLNPKVFYFKASPIAVKILSSLNVNLVSLANNHSLDFDYQGLKETLELLKCHDIKSAGAGLNLEQAHMPVIDNIQRWSIAMAAFCDHQLDFAANSNTPGIAVIDLSDLNSVYKKFKQSLDLMGGVDIPILSLHWGPNFSQRPSELFRKIAHNAIDIGYKLIYGHSAHCFLGMEVYKNIPIIYGAGDCIDDYYVDPIYKNDNQLLYQLEYYDNHWQQILLHPIFIKECRVNFANAKHAQNICKQMISSSMQLGVKFNTTLNNTLILNLN